MDKSTRQAIGLMLENIQMQLDNVRQLLFMNPQGEAGKIEKAVVEQSPDDIYTNKQEDDLIAKLMEVEEKDAPKFMAELFKEIDPNAKEASGLNEQLGAN